MLPIGILAGAAIGAATTYIYKDESSRQWLGEMSTKVKEGTQSLMDKFKKEEEVAQAQEAFDVEADEAAVAEAVDTEEDVQKKESQVA